MPNKLLGLMNCPMPPCGKAGAEVMQGEKGTPYIRCDACGTMIRTMTRGVKEWMRAQATPAAADPAPKPAAKPAADPAPKPAEKKGRSALDFLTGGG